MTTTDYELDYDVNEPPPSGPFWKPAQTVGELLILEVSHIDKDVKYKSNPPELVDYVYGQVHVLTGLSAGQVYNMATSAVKLVGQLKPKCGKRLVCRVKKESDDNNAAWVVDTKSITKDDRLLAEKYVKGEPVVDNTPPF